MAVRLRPETDRPPELPDSLTLTEIEKPALRLPHSPQGGRFFSSRIFQKTTIWRDEYIPGHKIAGQAFRLQASRRIDSRRLDVKPFLFAGQRDALSRNAL